MGYACGRGRAEWYRNRYVRSSGVASALGETPRGGAAVHAGFNFPANTNAIVQDGRTFAIVEAGARPYELTEELETIGACDFDGTLPGGYTAHPKRDPETGELHAVSYFWGWGNQVQYTVLGTDARVRRVVDIVARLCRESGDSDKARRYYHTALETFERLGSLAEPPVIRKALAELNEVAS